LAELAKVSPPSAVNWLAGICEIGLLAYAVAAAAEMGLVPVGVNPSTARLKRSKVGVSCSHRSPRLTTRLLFARQSSCTKTE
jgi:hypothetical protein